MDSLEIATYFDDFCNKRIDLTAQLIANELNIIIKVLRTPNSYRYQITFDGMVLNKRFDFDQAKGLVLELWRHIDDEQKSKILNSCKKGGMNSLILKDNKESFLAEYPPLIPPNDADDFKVAYPPLIPPNDADDFKVAYPPLIPPNNTDDFEIALPLMPPNDIQTDIGFQALMPETDNTNIQTSTLTHLSVQVSQSTTIVDKLEILELISLLEDAEDNNKEEQYFDLFFKLLNKLQGTGLIPEWLAHSANYAKKFLE